MAESLVDTVATALRLGSTSKTELSSEIERNIKAARSEMIRSGVKNEVAESDHELIVEAIVTYCLAKLGSVTTSDKYNESWLYQLDNLRKSTIELASDGGE